MRPGDDVATAGGSRAGWNVDRARDGDRLAAGVGRAVKDAKGGALPAHSGPAALKRPDPNNAARFSRNLPGAYVVKRFRCASAREAEQRGQGPSRYEPRKLLAAQITCRFSRQRFFNKIKQCRRVATRYDKLADNYLAFVKLAYIRLWLRVY